MSNVPARKQQPFLFMNYGEKLNMSRNTRALLLSAALMLVPISATAQELPTNNPAIEATKLQSPAKPAAALDATLEPRRAEPDGDSPLFRETCNDIGDGLQGCITLTPLTNVSNDDLRRMRESGRSPQDVIPLPAWCYNYRDAWYFTRTNACMISAGDYIIKQLPGGTPIGGSHFVYWAFSFTSNLQSNWQQQLEIQPTTVWGQAVGSTIQGEVSCAGACTMGFSNFPPQSAVVGRTVKGYGGINGTATAPSAYGFANTAIKYWFKSPCCAPSNPGYSVPPENRCDNATPGRGPGCVFSGYMPAIGYTDDPQYCCPELARHLRQAQLSGLPGAYGSTTYLTRLTDPVLQEQNRTTACKGSYVRPPGKSCDEYPMASTWQGARTGGGNPRSFPSWCSIPQVGPGSGLAGYSVCMINDTQNSVGGSYLSVFYGEYRVLDNERFQILAN